MAKKLLLYTIMVASLTLCVRAQGNGSSNYHEDVTFNSVDNLPNCLSSGTRNCVQNTQTGTLSQFSVAWIDGYLIGRNSAGSVYTLPFSTTNGRSNFLNLPGLAGTQWTSLAAGSNKEIYALNSTNSSGCTTAGTFRVYKANPAKTGWDSNLGCLSMVRAAHGAVAGLQGTAQTAWWSFNGGGSWEVVPAPFGAWTKITPVRSNFGYAVAGGCAYTVDKASGSWVASGIAGKCGVSDITGSPDVVWIKTTANTFMFYQRTASSPSWKTIYTAGINYTNLTGGDMFLMALNGSQPVHLNNIAPHVQERVSGNWLCPAGGCPQGSNHTLTTTIKWTAGSLWGPNGRTVTDAGFPATTLDAAAGDVASNCDLLFGDPTSASCQVTISAQVTCSVMGPLASWVQSTVHPKPVLTWAYYAGTTTSEIGGFLCDVHDYCSNPPPKCPSFPVFLDRADSGLSQDATCRAHTPWREYQFDVEFLGRPVFCTGEWGHLPGVGVVNTAIPTFNTVTTPQPCDQ